MLLKKELLVVGFIAPVQYGTCDYHASCDRDSAELYVSGRVESIVYPVKRALLQHVLQSRSRPWANAEQHLKFG